MIAGVQLVNILSDLVDSRIYPDLVTEHDNDTTPYIVYQDISTQPENTLDGFTGHEWVRMQIDVYHHDKHGGALLANQVIYAIDDAIPHSIYSGKLSMRDGDNHRQSIDYQFWQTTPTE